MTVVYVCNPACKLDRAGKSYVLLCMYVCMYVILLVRNYVQLSGFGNWALQKSGFPLCELLIKLGTFLPGATRGPFGGFFFGNWALQKSGFPNM